MIIRKLVCSSCNSGPWSDVPEGSDKLSNHVHFGSNQFSKHKISFQNTNQFSKHEISSQNTKSVLKTRNQFKIRFSNHKYINMDQ